MGQINKAAKWGPLAVALTAVTYFVIWAWVRIQNLASAQQKKNSEMSAVFRKMQEDGAYANYQRLMKNEHEDDPYKEV